MRRSGTRRSHHYTQYLALSHQYVPVIQIRSERKRESLRPSARAGTAERDCRSVSYMVNNAVSAGHKYLRFHGFYFTAGNKSLKREIKK